MDLGTLVSVKIFFLNGCLVSVSRFVKMDINLDFYVPHYHILDIDVHVSLILAIAVPFSPIIEIDPSKFFGLIAFVASIKPNFFS